MSGLNNTAKKMAETTRNVRPSTKPAKPAVSVFGPANPNTSKTQPDAKK